MTFVKGEIPEGAKPFQPGESGNPDGRPPGSKSWSTILNGLLDLAASDSDYDDENIKKIFGEKKATNREIILAKMVIEAKRDPNSKAAERLGNRVEGKPIETVKQQVEINTDKSISLSIDGKEIDLGK